MIEGSQSLFLELINDIIYMISLGEGENPSTARVDYINSRVKDITGFEPRDFMNNPSLWSTLVHPEDRDGVLRVTLRMMKEKRGGVREYRVKTKSGSYIWVEDRIIPVLEKGKVIGFVGVARDITKRKVLEELSITALEEDIENLLSSAVKRVKDALNADLVVVYEVPEGEREGVLRAGAGVKEKLINRLRLPLEEGTEFHYAFYSRKPVVIKDTEREKRFRLSSDTFLLGLKSGLCLPVREGPNLYGTFCIYTKRKKEFSEEEVRFAQSVANLIGLALRRQRFEKRLESSERKLQKVNRLYRTLSEISAVILKGGKTDEVLAEVCRVCVQHGGFKASWIGLLEDSRLKVLCSYGDIENFLERVEKPILERIERGKGPCGRAMVEGRMIINNDTESSVDDERLRKEMLRRGFLSSASIPILKEGKVAGLFVLYAGEKGFFDEETESLVREIGEEITFSIEFTEKEDRLNKLSLAVEQSSDWILITDRNGRIQYANESVSKISGYRLDELIGKKTNIFKSGKHSQNFYRRLWGKVLTGETFRSVFINRRKDGRLFYLDQTITPIKDKLGEVVGFVATGKDITQEKELKDRLNYIAYYDPITELPNRVNFVERLNFSISRNKMLSKNLAVLFIDIDRFKYVNDTHGYIVGDSVLKEVGRRIRSVVREGDTVARLGSDEFGVVLTDLATKEDIPRVIGKIFSEMEKPINAEGEELRLTLSVGVSVYPEDGREGEELIKKAEMALAHAKEDTRNSYQFFREEMNAKITETLLMEKHLFRATENEEFLLYFQPYFDLKNLNPVGMEALLRWKSEDLGFVYPSKFIPILESTGLIVEVGNWILRKACEVAQKTGKVVSVNVSPVQFKDRELPKRIENVINEEGLNGGYITLEITENLLMDDVEFASKSLRKLKSLGIRVAIDDFGTGYSSLAYLKTLPVDFLKIDVSFVRDIDRDPDDRAIVNAIIQLAKNLGLRTIAEGIENEKQLQILKDMGCDFGQGYHLAKPMPEEELMTFLKI